MTNCWPIAMINNENGSCEGPPATLLLKICKQQRSDGENFENNAANQNTRACVINEQKHVQKTAGKVAIRSNWGSPVEERITTIPNGAICNGSPEGYGETEFSLLFFFAKGHMETKVVHCIDEFPDLMEGNSQESLNVEATFVSLFDAVEARKKLLACSAFNSALVEISIQSLSRKGQQKFDEQRLKSNAPFKPNGTFVHLTNWDTTNDAVFNAPNGSSHQIDSSKIVGVENSQLGRKRNLSLGAYNESSGYEFPLMNSRNTLSMEPQASYSHSFSLMESPLTGARNIAFPDISTLDSGCLSWGESSFFTARSFSLSEVVRSKATDDFSIEFLSDEPLVQKPNGHELFRTPVAGTTQTGHIGQRSMSISGIPNETNRTSLLCPPHSRKGLGNGCPLPSGNSLGTIVGENAPCNTLYVGNLPVNACEEELRAMFSKCIGYKRLSFKNKLNGPMCFVEFEDIHCATVAMNELYGVMLSNSCKNGIRLSYSKNPLGVKPQPGVGNAQPALKGPSMTLEPFDLIPAPVIQNTFSPLAC